MVDTGLDQATDSPLLPARLSPPPDSLLDAELGLDEAGLRPAFVVRYPAGSVAQDLEMNEAGAALLQLFADGRRTASVVSAYETPPPRTRRGGDRPHRPRPQRPEARAPPAHQPVTQDRSATTRSRVGTRPRM